MALCQLSFSHGLVASWPRGSNDQLMTNVMAAGGPAMTDWQSMANGVLSTAIINNIVQYYN